MPPLPDDPLRISAIGRCPICRSLLAGQDPCPACGRSWPVRDGIWHACEPLSGNNQVAAQFYDSEAWDRFRPWEHGFLWLVGGRDKARLEILAAILARKPEHVLEVGIGDGENLDFFPASTRISGVDIARTPMKRCLQKHPRMENQLAHAEAENLPFPDATFDATFSVGGFNLFRDPLLAYREMQRVTRSGGLVVVADERPDLKTWGIGHLIGWKRLDRIWLGGLGLPRDFAQLVIDADPKIVKSVVAANPRARQLAIWKRLGYCLGEQVQAPNVGSID